MSEKTDQEFTALFNGVPVQKAFEIAKYIDQLVDQEKRSTAIAFLNAVSQDGCSNYFRKGDEWFLGDPEEEEDAEGPFTTEQLYDQFIINSL